MSSVLQKISDHDHKLLITYKQFFLWLIDKKLRSTSCNHIVKPKRRDFFIHFQAIITS